MMLPRRKFLHLAGGAAAFPAIMRVASAQSYPVAPGASACRLSARRHRRPHRAANRSMAVGTARSAIRDREPAGRRQQYRHRVGREGNTDGYTLLLVSFGQACNTAIYDNLNFDFVRDIAPIASIIRTPAVMEVNPSSRPKPCPSSSPTPRPILASQHGDRPAPGAGHTLSASCSKTMAGVDLRHGALSGRGPALPDLMSGQFRSCSIPLLRQLVTSGAASCGPWCNNSHANRRAAGRSPYRRFCGGLRSKRLGRHRRPCEYAAANHRDPQQGS